MLLIEPASEGNISIRAAATLMTTVRQQSIFKKLLATYCQECYCSAPVHPRDKINPSIS